MSPGRSARTYFSNADRNFRNLWRIVRCFDTLLKWEPYLGLLSAASTSSKNECSDATPGMSGELFGYYRVDNPCETQTRNRFARLTGLILPSLPALPGSFLRPPGQAPPRCSAGFFANRAKNVE